MNLTSLSAQDLIDQERGAIWVLNTCDQVVDGGGDVQITVIVHGQPRILRVPRTWLPIEATKAIPRKQILESAFFLEAISKGLIMAISTEDAEVLLGQEGSDDELNRLAEAESIIRQAIQTKGYGRNVTISGSSDELEEEDQPVKKAFKAKIGRVDGKTEDSINLDDVSASFKAWVQKLNMAETSEAAMIEIRRRAQITPDEAQYLADNISHGAIASKLRQKISSSRK